MTDAAEFLRNENDPSLGFCARCGGWFKLELMAADRRRASGYRPICKRCDSERGLERYNRLHPKVERHCSICGAELQGRQRLVCSSRCAEKRFERLHPEAAKAREAKRVERRREARRRAREARAAEVGPEG